MKAMTWVECAVVGMLVVVVSLLAAPMAERVWHARAAERCVNHLKQLGMALKMYTAESRGGVYPPLSPIRDNWMFVPSAMYPEYVSDFSHLSCPAARNETVALAPDEHDPNGTVGQPNPDCLWGASYQYTGFVMHDDLDALAIYDLDQMGLLPRGVHGDADPSPLGYGLGGYHPGQGEIPAMWDRVSTASSGFSHRPVGANVLFVDGHVEWLPYADSNPHHHFPATRIAAKTFGASRPQLPPECASTR